MVEPRTAKFHGVETTVVSVGSREHAAAK